MTLGRAIHEGTDDLFGDVGAVNNLVSVKRIDNKVELFYGLLIGGEFVVSVFEALFDLRLHVLLRRRFLRCNGSLRIGIRRILMSLFKSLKCMAFECPK
ncbi:Uncharacterised protein [BD1-7 clade bacterium]|uniref:Uncharacterized protein n=1 Tax=BD1-7 clade bacterium TaxID=2029982 RepID=A0A5S9PY90_9GAMM|nr:Uncharacterised protein [BD1-7 clade bacterium]CAA0113215.1 Uncharacterised protein [BD1-7 clade bacterium]